MSRAFSGACRHLARIIPLTLIMSAVFFSGSMPGSAKAATPDPIVGNWTVTYGEQATVEMSLDNGVYTETAKTPVEVTGSFCYLPAGTVIATFSQTGPGTYAGQHGLWYTNDCSFDEWTSTTFTLSSDGDTLTAVLAPTSNYSGSTVVFTKIALKIQASLRTQEFSNDTTTPPQVELTVTVTNPDGTPALGATVQVSTLPGDEETTNVAGEATFTMPVTLTSATGTITATSDDITTSVAEDFWTVKQDFECAVSGYPGKEIRDLIDYFLTKTEPPLAVLKFFVDLFSSLESHNFGQRPPVIVSDWVGYQITVPGSQTVYAAKVTVLGNGKTIETMGPEFSHNPIPDVTNTAACGVLV
jgi:uncharacterized protein (DUF2147 family)